MNIIIDNGNVLPTDQKTLFGCEDVTVLFCKTLPELYTSLKLYKSKGECIRANRTGDIPPGWSVLKATKIVTVYIWNPTDRE